MALEHRIVKYDTADPKTLTGNPYNFRKHPEHQHGVVDGSLDELGWIDEVLVNLRTSEAWPEGERNVLTVIDGHLRRDIAIERNEASIPVKYVDLTPDEERLALAVLDESTALAQRDVETLSELLALLAPENQALADFLAELADEAGQYPDFEPLEDLSGEPEETYRDDTEIVVKVVDYAARVLAIDAIAAVLQEHPEWEGTIASKA